MSGWTDAELVRRFERALDQDEYGLKPGDGVRLVEMAVKWANEKAKRDPKLGRGKDTRAVFALSEGITIGAMAMCDVWRQLEAEAADVKPGHHPTPEGHRWVCHCCRFTCDSVECAEEHILGEPDNFGHWVYEHLGGFRGNAPTREMHSSDAGGVYLTPIEPEHADELTRRWRQRIGG